VGEPGPGCGGCGRARVDRVGNLGSAILVQACPGDWPGHQAGCHRGWTPLPRSLRAGKRHEVAGDGLLGVRRGHRAREREFRTPAAGFSLGGYTASARRRAEGAGAGHSVTDAAGTSGIWAGLVVAEMRAGGAGPCGRRLANLHFRGFKSLRARLESHPRCCGPWAWTATGVASLPRGGLRIPLWPGLETKSPDTMPLELSSRPRPQRLPPRHAPLARQEPHVRRPARMVTRRVAWKPQ